MVKVIDLFAGAGGLSLGASRAGFDICAAVEWDKNAIHTHSINFPNVRHIQEDILELNAQTLLKVSNVKQNDLSGIIGGPPCQGFSSIGHGNADDPRNTLFIKFFYFVQELQPLFFIAENVPGIMNTKYDSIRTQAFNLLNNYSILPPIAVNASDFGAPTSRTRIFFIGYRKSARIKPITIADIELMKVAPSDKTTVRQALEGLPGDIRYSPKSVGTKLVNEDYLCAGGKRIQSDFIYDRFTGNIPNGIGDQEYIDNYINGRIINGCIPTKHRDDVKKRYSSLKYGQRDEVSKATKLDPDKFCPTIRAGTGPDKGSFQAVRPIHFKYSRVITPREAARLQGFPDWFKLPDTIWHSFRQIGNSVSPIAAEKIMASVYQKLIL